MKTRELFFKRLIAWLILFLEHLEYSTIDKIEIIGIEIFTLNAMTLFWVKAWLISHLLGKQYRNSF